MLAKRGHLYDNSVPVDSRIVQEKGEGLIAAEELLLIISRLTWWLKNTYAKRNSVSIPCKPEPMGGFGRLGKFL